MPLKIENYGPIKAMSLPEGLEERPLGEPHWAYKVREFTPIGAANHDIELEFYREGLALNDETAHAVKKFLAGPARDLSKEDLSTVRDVVGDIGNPEEFETRVCRVENHNGQFVLLVEGQFYNSKINCLKIYADADDCRFIQKISFIAPQKHYKEWIESVRAAFNTIEWQTRN